MLKKILKKILEDFEPKATQNITTMKRKYDKPTMKVVVLQQSTQLLAGSVRGLSNNADLNEEIGASSEPARARQNSGWDDRDDWDE